MRRRSWSLAALLALMVSLLVAAPASAAGTCDDDGVDAKVPVLLVHGFAVDASWWEWGDRSMYEVVEGLDGFAPVLFDYGQYSLEWVTDPHIGPALAQRIACLAEKSANAGGAGKVVVLAHSMGGLALRCAVAPDCGGTPKDEAGNPVDVADKVALAITMGTPNTGSDMLSGLRFDSAHTGQQDRAALGYRLLCWAQRDVYGTWCERTFSEAARSSDAAKAMTPTSGAVTNLPYLPARIPLAALAAKIDVPISVYGSPLVFGGDDPDGDGVVAVRSALADGKISGRRTGPGSGDRTVDCGRLRLVSPDPTLGLPGLPRLLGGYGPLQPLGVPDFSSVPCWHHTISRSALFQDEVEKILTEHGKSSFPSLLVANAFGDELYPADALPLDIGVDSNAYFTNLSWDPVTLTSARATGMLVLEICAPYCDGSVTESYAVEVIASRPASCLIENAVGPGGTTLRQKRQVFTTVSVRGISSGVEPHYLGDRVITPTCG